MGCCSKQPVASTDVYAQEKKTGVAPANSRKCRDVLCCLLFGVFWVGMAVVAIVGIVNGEPKRLLYGSDYHGVTCGAGNMTARPLTFYPRMSEDLLEQSSKFNNKNPVPTDFEFYGVCVAACPPQYSYFCNDEFEAALAADKTLATDAARDKARKTEADKLFGEKRCWFVAMASQKVFYRCIQMTETNSTTVETCIYPADEPKYYSTDAHGVQHPNDLCEVKQVRVISDSKGPAQENPIYDKLQTAAAMVGRAIGDIQHSWEIVLLFGGGAALVLGLVLIFLMKYFAGCMVWITLWSFVLMLLLFALMVSTKAGIIKSGDIAKLSSSLADAGLVTASQNGFQIPDNLRASEDKKKVYTYVAYVSYALTGVAFLLVCFFQKRIRICVGIIKEASRAIQRLPLLVLFPLVPFVLVLVLFIYSVIIAAYIYSSSSINVDQLGGAASTALSKVNPNDAMRVLFAYHFFGFLWTNQLINAISMCTIAGAICRYYWSREKNAAEMGRFPILYSFKNCFRYHFGSLAFGALIIAIVQFIRAILLYIDHQTQDLQKSNLVVKVVLKVVQCCMWCLEKCLKFLSKNAYIMIAMKGHSFCASAKDAFKMIFTNAAQIATVSMVTFLLLSAAKIAITMACATMTFAYLEHNNAKYGTGGPKEISSPMAPILLTMVLAWFVASTFMGVYEMAIDTILLCFCEDREINKATGQYFMSDKLRQFVASVPVSKPAGDHHDDGINGGETAPPVAGSNAVGADI